MLVKDLPAWRVTFSDQSPRLFDDGRPVGGRHLNELHWSAVNMVSPSEARTFFTQFDCSPNIEIRYHERR